jgi:hypothetical protein
MQAARGELCNVNIVGVCNYDADTTVVAHIPDGSGGSSRLVGPLSITFACSDCHDVLDGRQQVEMESGDRDFYLRRGQTRTINRLIELGLVRVTGL